MMRATIKPLLAVWLVAGAPVSAFAQIPHPVAPAAPAAAPTTPASGTAKPVSPAPPTAPAAPTPPAAKAAPGPAAATAKPVAPPPASGAAHPAPAVAAAAPSPAAPAASPPAAPAIAPKPPAELDQMKGLEGTWRCDGRAPAGPGGPEHAYKSTWKFKRDLDNFWWAAEYQQVKAKSNPLPMKARGYMTYDPGTKSFVMLGVDNMGGTSSESTPGWTGDSVTLAGDASQGGRKIPFREVITKNGEREFTWRGEMKIGSDWVTLGEDRCKK